MKHTSYIIGMLLLLSAGASAPAIDNYLDFKDIERKCGFCGPTNNFPISEFEELETVIQRIDENVETLILENIIIESKLSVLIDECGETTPPAQNSCAPQPISQSSIVKGVYSITVPGSYCLATDITGSIIITASNVTLDLNEHTINGTAKGDGVHLSKVNNVRLINGRIIGNGKEGTQKSAGNGISLQGVNGFTAEDLIISSWQNGISVQKSDGVVIKESSATNNTTGIDFFCSENMTIAESACSHNRTGLSIRQSRSATIARSAFNQNDTEGVSVEFSDCIECVNCSADGNCTGFGCVGIACDSSSSSSSSSDSDSDCSSSSDAECCKFSSAGLVMRDCSACFNRLDGFQARAVGGIVLKNCFASGNLNGFFMKDGSSALVRECIASQNSKSSRSDRGSKKGFGFGDDGKGNSQYFSNTACENDSNYSSCIRCAPVSSPQNARGVDNIDCCKESSDECDTQDSSNPCGFASLVICQDDFLACSRSIDIKGHGEKKTNKLILSEPGVYVLGADVHGTIIIESSRVTLDLNGFSLMGDCGNGIIISDPCNTITDVHIKNGLLYGGSVITRAPATPIAGITVDGSGGRVAAITIENISATGWTNGIYAQSVTDLTITGCMCRNNSNDGILIQECSDVELANNSCDLNGTLSLGAGNGIEVADGQKIHIERCSVNSNISNGIAIGTSTADDSIECISCRAASNGVDGFNINGSSGILFRHCLAELNGNGIHYTHSSCVQCFECVATNNSGDGFLIDANSDSIVLGDCAASCNSNGIHTQASTGINILHCNAQGNSGISAPPIAGSGNGFFIEDLSTVLVQDCTATGNRFGFNDDDSTENPNQYYSNVACNNIIENYRGVLSAPITSPANARGVDNVDCASSALDQIDIIQNIVESSASLIENILVDIETTLGQVSIIEIIVQENSAISRETLSIVEHTSTIVEDINDTTQATFSKVCIIESIVENISSVVDQTAVTVDSIQSTVESTASFVQNINTTTIETQSLVEQILGVVQANACCSTIAQIAQEMATTLNTVVQIESIVKDIAVTSDQTLSIVENISSVVDQTAITVDAIEETVIVTESYVEIINDTTKETLSIVENISSTTEHLEAQVDALQSVVLRIESIVEDIEISSDKTLSIVENISAVVDEMEEDVDAIQSIVENISSVVNQIDENSELILSKLSILESLVPTIDAHLIIIQSAVENIESIVIHIDNTSDETLTIVERIESIVERINCGNQGAQTLSIVERIESIVEDISQTGDETLSLVERIESIVENIQCTSGNLCAPKAVPVTGIITASGTYCLSADHNTGTITITGPATSVILDLNGFTVQQVNAADNGIVVTPSAGVPVDVRIMNGLLKGISGAGNGIELNSGASNVRLINLTITGWTDGINATSADQLFIQGVISETNGGNGLNCINCSNVAASESEFNDNTLNGITVTGTGSGNQFVNCTANGNTLSGFDIEAMHVLVRDCYACGNMTDGFYAASLAEDICYVNCLAEDNTLFGFDIVNGAASTSASFVRLCSATVNGTGGFNTRTAVNSNRFYQNAACNNGAAGAVNYVGNFNAPAALPALANPFDNVKGS